MKNRRFHGSRIPSELVKGRAFVGAFALLQNKERNINKTTTQPSNNMFDNARIKEGERVHPKENQGLKRTIHLF